MRGFDKDDAVLLAATEILPGEWRDLSDLLLRLAKQNKGLRSHLGSESMAGDELGKFLAENLDPSRVAFWERRLATLAGESAAGAGVIGKGAHPDPVKRASIDAQALHPDIGKITAQSRP